jgi:hypothetical protein
MGSSCPKGAVSGALAAHARSSCCSRPSGRPGRRNDKRKPFVVVPYVANAQGVLRAVLPQHCIHAGPNEQGSCHMVIGYYRHRKTGPCFPIAVAGCSTHAKGRYTLYPPGHVPYSRAAIVAVSSAPDAETPLVNADTGRRDPSWESTVFGAAIDAAAGQRWPCDRIAPRVKDERRRRTQGRRLELAGRIVGVHPQLAPPRQQRIAARLRVATLTLRTASKQWGSSWTHRGAAVMAAVVTIAVDASMLDRVLAAGHLAGAWPAANRWSPRRGEWIRSPGPSANETVTPDGVGAGRSNAPEHRKKGSPRGRAPPTTNSHGARESI